MNLEFGRKWAGLGSPSQWWEALGASVITGRDALGAYLGTRGLTLAQVHKSLSGLQVKHWATYPLEAGLMAEAPPALQDDLAAWALQSSPVSLAVSPRLGFFRHAALPRAARENLAKVVAYELERFLPLPADRLLYGFQILAETDSQILLMLMAVPRERVELCLAWLQEAGLRPAAVELAPVAAAQTFTLSGRSLPPSWLLLHLEDNSFELTHLLAGKVNSFTQGHNLQGQELSRAIQARIEAALAARPEPQMLALYGRGAFKAGRLEEHALEVIHPSHLPITGFQADSNWGEVLPAVGAGLAGLGKTPPGVNLLPPEERTATRLNRYSFTGLLLMIIVGLLVLWGASALVHTGVALYRTNRQIAKLKPEAQKVENLLKDSRALAAQMESLRKIRQSPDKLVVLKDLTRLIPDNTWLFNLRLSKLNVDLRGMSRSASDLIPRFDKSRLFKKAEFASPIVTDANKLEHFKIKAEFRNLEPRS